LLGCGGAGVAVVKDLVVVVEVVVVEIAVVTSTS
jgi:hypothetical protein